MANDIATHTVGLVRNFSETLDNLVRLQAVTAGCSHAEDNEDAWMLRQHFMAMCESQWGELSTLLREELLPFVADMRGGLRCA